MLMIIQESILVNGKIIEEYKNKLDSNKMDESDGGTLGLKKANTLR